MIWVICVIAPSIVIGLLSFNYLQTGRLKINPTERELSASDLVILAEKENVKNIEKIAKYYYKQFQTEYLKSKKNTFYIQYRGYTRVEERVEENKIYESLCHNKSNMNLFLKYFQDKGWFVTYNKTNIPEEPYLTDCYQLVFTLSSEPKE